MSGAQQDLPAKVRAFVAVAVPEEVRERLARVQTELAAELHDVSWTRRDAMHLTLHFFGNVESARLGELIEVLGNVAVRHSAMRLGLHGVGQFSQRVIWAGVMGDVEELRGLAAAVHERAASFGSQIEDRRFNAHVTLGRLRLRPQSGFAAKLQRWQAMEFGEFRSEHIELIRSELSPHGSRYSVLASLPFTH